jgi:hypothetical protein
MEFVIMEHTKELLAIASDLPGLPEPVHEARIVEALKESGRDLFDDGVGAMKKVVPRRRRACSASGGRQSSC